MREDVQKNEKLVEKMRGQIRELTNEKLRLENENKGLEEKSHLWMLKSEELEMQNSVIDEERQLLKEKVCFLDESMAELQSCTEHLRQQLQTLGRQEEEARIEKDLLKEQLQNYKDEQRQYVECMTDKHEEAVHKSKNKPLVYQTNLSYNEASVVGSPASQVPCSQTIQESNMGRTENTRLGNSAFEKQRKDFNRENLSSDQDNMMKRIETLTNENDELRSKVLALEHADNELQKNMATVTQDHRGVIEGKEEEIRAAKEQSKVFQEDLEEKVTEVVLLQAQVLEMEKTRNNAQKEIRKMEKELRSTKGARGTDIFLPRHENISENIHPLVKQVKGAGGDETDNVEGLSTNVSNLRQQFQSLNRELLDKEQTIRWLHERLSESEHRVLEMTALLEDLAKRKEILVNKLEMMGAVTVVRNECDIPDGYQEAVDGILRSQCSTIEKGVLAMVREAEAKQNERKVMEEECKRLEYNTEALETENLLLKVQVSDLSQSVEELEEDIIYMKCGGKDGNRPSKRLGSPKSGGSGGHRVTFDSDVDLEKREGEKLGALIENAKRRCVALERQIRSNTSLLKATQHQNETLSRAREELQRQNCHLRRCVVDFQQTNKILHIKVVSLESRLKVVDERKSLDEMEKQSLEDRLKVMEGKMKCLKEKKKSLKKSVVEALQGEPNNSDEAHLMAKSQSEGLQVVDDVFAERTNFRNEMERLKNKVKHQSAHSRILKCEIFEFLDDIRCLESELRCAVDSVESADHEWSPLDQTKIVSTWKDEASLCQQEGMAAIMTEILELLKTAIQQLQRISHNAPLSTTDSVDARDATTERQTLLRKQFQEDTEKLRNEKRCILREVLAMKDVFEHLLDKSDSPEAGNKAREEERSQELKKQVLFYVETNSQMEGDVLDHLNQQSALEEELRNLKENILNLKVEKEVLLSLNDSVGSQCLAHSCNKSCDKITRNFCFVKHHGNGLESPEVFRMESDHDNEDVFGCPSDEGVCHNVCHSPDREASSCDSGYHSGRYDEGHSVHMSDKGDTAHHNRYVSTDHPVRPSLGSFYENIEREQKRSEMASILTPEKKPKGILKKRVVTEDKETASSLLKVAEDGSNGTDASSCKVCNFSDLFKPFKRTTLENEH